MKFLLIITSLLVLSNCSSVLQSGGMSRAYKAYDKKQCGKVYLRLNEVKRFGETSPELKSEISYLTASCLETEKKYNEALSTYAYVAEQFPNTEFGYRSKTRVNSLTRLMGKISKIKSEQANN